MSQMHMNESEPEETQGDVPEGLGPEVFREHLERAAKGHDGSSAHITLEETGVWLEDIESVEAEPEGGRSRVRLRNGVIIAGLTGAAIVAALATVRYRHRRQA
jgi:hypothetical protein